MFEIIVYIGYKRLSDNKTLRYPPLVLERHLLSKFGWMFSIEQGLLTIQGTSVHPQFLAQYFGVFLHSVMWTIVCLFVFCIALCEPLFVFLFFFIYSSFCLSYFYVQLLIIPFGIFGSVLVMISHYYASFTYVILSPMTSITKPTGCLSWYVC